MIRFIYSTLAYLVANAVGLLLATTLLPGFTIDLAAFVVAVLIFSGVQVIFGPLVTKLSAQYFPQLLGGVALVTVFFGLLVTQILMAGMDMGGIANWLAATLLVWIGSLLAGILLPIFVFKSLAENAKERRDAISKDVEKAEAAARRAERAARQAQSDHE